MSSFFIKSGGNFFLTDENQAQKFETLPAANYVVRFDIMTKRFFLEQLEPFSVPEKIYGDTTKNAKRILYTYKNREYNTGVLLAGEKGSGKTLEGRMVSILGKEDGIPTIVVNEPHCGPDFNQFMQKISQPCIIFFDEFEKVYDREQQESLLTLLDGVFQTKKLFLFTSNDRYKIDMNMMNRPGRIYYFLEYSGLDIDFIEEYCQENLNNQEFTKVVVNMSFLFEKFNFDMLKAIVEESNRYEESPLESVKFINVKLDTPRENYYEVDLEVNGIKQENLLEKWVYANPLDQDEEIIIQEGPVDKQRGETHTFSFDDIKEMNIKHGKFVYMLNNKRVTLTQRKSREVNVTNAYQPMMSI